MSDELGTEQAPAVGENTAPAAPAAALSHAVSPSAGAPQPATPAEDRSNWLPPYRAREMRDAATREATQKYQGEMSQIKTELDRYRSQVQALVGVTPQQNTESDAIKTQFFNLFPWAKKLEERFGDVESLIDRSQDMNAQVDHYWTTYGNQSMDRLFKLATDGLGAPLNDESKQQLHSSFVGFIQSSPERQARYASDPSIVDDFWKQFTQSFVDPVRRASSAGIAQRATLGARLPQDSPSGAPQSSPGPKLNGLDERAAAAWAEFQSRTGR